jgi:hypothetical protein
MNQLCLDSGDSACFGQPRRGLTLARIDPSLVSTLSNAILTFFPTFAPEFGPERVPHTRRRSAAP